MNDENIKRSYMHAFEVITKKKLVFRSIFDWKPMTGSENTRSVTDHDHDHASYRQK